VCAVWKALFYSKLEVFFFSFFFEILIDRGKPRFIVVLLQVFSFMLFSFFFLSFLCFFFSFPFFAEWLNFTTGLKWRR
jgi:hypothetical protein